ncbi:MAG: hypothetical protein HY308_02230 [Gammaproteobacteria bacterium]|nr:hypothetical protein [Gammaproteobacteria bacterium]
MNNKRVKVFIVLIFSLLPACATWSTPKADGEPARDQPVEQRLTANDLEALMSYTATLQLLSSDELRREYERVEANYNKDENITDRLKLAALLSVRHAEFRNDTRARDLLLQSVGDGDYDSQLYRSLAALLLVMLDERRTLEHSVEDERRQRQALSKKLEQLRAIEEEIDRRTSPPVITPRNGQPRTNSGS